MIIIIIIVLLLFFFLSGLGSDSICSYYWQEIDEQKNLERKFVEFYNPKEVVHVDKIGSKCSIEGRQQTSF